MDVSGGLWSRDRRRRAHRQRRSGRRTLGVVQLDGSFHNWLEGRGRGCLMNMVDDATGTTLCRLGKEETIWAAVGVLKAWMERYGVPRRCTRTGKRVCAGAERGGADAGEVPVTQFGRMCEALGIEIWRRVPAGERAGERNHGTHQDRLVKKLRRKGIRTHAEATATWGKRTARSTMLATRSRRRLPGRSPAPPGARKLGKIFRLETERVLSNDWVVQHEKRFYQVERQSRHHAPARVR